MPTFVFRQSTAGQEILIGKLLDSTDGNTAETGQTIAAADILIWKAGATTLVAKNSGGATEISDGYYYATLDATDTNTAGGGVISCHMAGCLLWERSFIVYPATVYDALVAGSANLPTEPQDASQTFIDALLDEALTGHSTQDTLGGDVSLARKIVTNKRAISGTTETLYDDDGTTPLVQHTLDSATAPTSKTPV
jgi:hypothetical protein